MIKKEVADLILTQVYNEFLSEKQYIAMEMYFKSMYLNGYAKLFHEYAEEERRHAYKLLDFLDECNCDTKFSVEKINIEKEFTSPLGVFETAYAHEIQITKQITNIYELACNKKDYISAEFLNWYLMEQREEEDKMKKRLVRLKLAKNDVSAILFLDREDGLE